MSAKHPVIAVTGSSGAGTTTTSLAFRKIFAQLNLRAASVLLAGNIYPWATTRSH